MKYRVVKVEDTKESLSKAMKEMNDALMKGSGIGFDVSNIKSKKKRNSALKQMEKQYFASTIGKRTSR